MINMIQNAKDQVLTLTNAAYAKAEEILSEHAEELQKTAQLLLEKEHLTGAEFAAIFEPKPVEQPAEEQPTEEAPATQPAEEAPADAPTEQPASSETNEE